MPRIAPALHVPRIAPSATPHLNAFSARTTSTSRLQELAASAARRAIKPTVTTSQVVPVGRALHAAALARIGTPATFVRQVRTFCQTALALKSAIMATSAMTAGRWQKPEACAQSATRHAASARAAPPAKSASSRRTSPVWITCVALLAKMATIRKASPKWATPVRPAPAVARSARVPSDVPFATRDTSSLRTRPATRHAPTDSMATAPGGPVSLAPTPVTGAPMPTPAQIA